MQKRRREARVEPKVKVNAPVVEAVTGGAPLTPVAQAETTYVNALGAYFAFVLAEGIVLASSVSEPFTAAARLVPPFPLPLRPALPVILPARQRQKGRQRLSAATLPRPCASMALL